MGRAINSHTIEITLNRVSNRIGSGFAQGVMEINSSRDQGCFKLLRHLYTPERKRKVRVRDREHGTSSGDKASGFGSYTRLDSSNKQSKLSARLALIAANHDPLTVDLGQHMKERGDVGLEGAARFRKGVRKQTPA